MNNIDRVSTVLYCGRVIYTVIYRSGNIRNYTSATIPDTIINFIKKSYVYTALDGSKLYKLNHD